jgi:hypothetical protein
MVMTTTVEFASGLTLSRAVAGEAATASSVFSLQKNGAEFATITFAASGTVGTFVCASDTSFASGDVFSIVTPSPRDATLGDISLTVTGFR